MAYEKFTLNFTLIDQIVYEIITNQFILVTVRLTNFFASNNFFSIDFKNMVAKKELSVICIYRDKEYSRKKINYEFV